MHSSWEDFTRDFGDAIGGIFIGYGLARESITLGTIGTFMVLLSVYLRFYYKKKQNGADSTNS